MENEKNLRELARHIESQIEQGRGFALLTFDFGEGGRLAYISNGQRQDIVNAMIEFIANTRTGFGTHKP